MIKVEGYQNLYRDEKTGAIINCDSTEYQNHLNILNYKNMQKSELDKIKNDIDEIKLLLKEIINGSR